MLTSSAPVPVVAGPLTLHLLGVTDPFTPRITVRELAAQIWLITLELTAASAAEPPPCGLRWSLPARDIHATWWGDQRGDRFFTGHAAGDRSEARACSAAPVLVLHSDAGINGLTMGGSDPLHRSTLSAGIHEESATFTCTARWFTSSLPADTRFAVSLRLDLRPVPMAQALRELAQWWESLPDLTPLRVPEAGRLPMYSTWYSFHQSVEPAAVEAECALAKELGCAAVIVDDGWQTRDAGRGYAYCGDWEPERTGDMAAHVRRIHALGLKFLLWYSVPFIGMQSRSYARFRGKFLREDEQLKTAVLDPRYPEVRDFLIGLYERHLREWDLDGFKLDFVDSFSLPDGRPATAEGGRDIADVDEAAVRLLRDVAARLRAIKPDVLIEFRQSYIGPVMRTVGNLFRAGDCPNDAQCNRRRTLDIRLICGSTACHADMLMWNISEPVESAALQLLNVLFSVPQISVMLARLPSDHQAMLRFWLGWWRAHRATLLDGELRVRRPDLGYTQAEARTAGERIVCCYSAEPVTVAAGDPPLLQVVNAHREAGVVIDLPPGRTWSLTIHDTQGIHLAQFDRRLAAGLHRLPIPAAGLGSLGPADG